MLHLSDRWEVSAFRVDDEVIGTYDDDDPSKPVTELYVDEIHFGVRDGKEVFITVFSDQNHDVLYLTDDHTKECMREMSDFLISHGRKPKDVKFMSMDMAKQFKAGAKEYFPKAKIILDRFHLMKNVNEALNNVRKRTYRELDEEKKEGIGKIMYTLLYNADNLPEKHEGRMKNIRMVLPELAVAYDLKEEFRLVFEHKTRKGGKEAFEKWYGRVLESGIKELIKKAESMMERLDDILPWFTHRISNGGAEGLNNKIQKIKSDAYGFRHPKNFMDFIYFRKARIPISVRRRAHVHAPWGFRPILFRLCLVPMSDGRAQRGRRLTGQARWGQPGTPGASRTASPNPIPALISLFTSSLSHQ